ncbi:MAG TPA: DUF421 domain-containing protein [Clostridia bacterium]|nr:DUF421 domain-containing protein [Clostridia bacterium]
MSWGEITVRLVATYFAMLIMARLMGKIQLTQLTFFNYITGITVGTVTATMIFTPGFILAKGLYALALWGLLTMLMEYLSIKSIGLRRIIDGQPVILIQHGEVVKSALYKTRLNLDQLKMLLRKENVYDMKEVDYAILENNGELSVLKKDEFKNTLKKDLGLPLNPASNMPTEVISDSRILDDNLKRINLDRNWLRNEISKLGFRRTEDIFYAEVASDGQLYVMPVHKKDSFFRPR